MLKRGAIGVDDTTRRRRWGFCLGFVEVFVAALFVVIVFKIAGGVVPMSMSRIN